MDEFGSVMTFNSVWPASRPINSIGHSFTSTELFTTILETFVINSVSLVLRINVRFPGTLSLKYKSTGNRIHLCNANSKIQTLTLRSI